MVNIRFSQEKKIISWNIKKRKGLAQMINSVQSIFGRIQNFARAISICLARSDILQSLRILTRFPQDTTTPFPCNQSLNTSTIIFFGSPRQRSLIIANFSPFLSSSREIANSS